MNPEQDSTPDHFQQIWQAETAWPQVTINTDSLREEVRGAQGRFRHIINCRDAREIGIGLVMLPVWLVMGIRQSQPWTWYLTIPAILFVISFMLIDRWRHPQKPSEPGEPLLFYVRESLAQVEHQIWLLRNVFWWYLLPFSLSIMAYFIQTGWQTASNLWGFLAQVGFSGAFLWLVYWGIWKLNQIAVRNQLEPRRQTLQKLIDSLESDQPGEDSTDLFDLVSSLDQPQSGARLNYDWVGSWNRLVPSWTISLGIILATLGGALLGAFFPIPGMGPVLFQSIVAAVLCNEFALILAWLRIRKSKEQTSKDDSEMTTLCNASGHFRSQLKQVRTPAFLILCLAYLMGILAFVALCAFFFTDSDAALVQRGPGLENISQWTEEDIAHLDSWLQRFVGEDDFYPSLSAAIVRDGELIYSRSFGYADQESKTLATPQTRFHVASVTKVFTATLAAILAERGLVDLDQPVLQYLPKGISISTMPEVGAKITLRQLASHTSGLPRGVPGKVQSVEGWYELEPELLYKQLATIKLESEPGTAELYSNLGFGLLGHALERAANQPLHKLVDELICKPLQLERTAIQHDDSLDV
ncbi:MAG: beta-lactamase family protein, partial [Planctomycetaceae bacterium]|nr:beta-lactamase family protein [Planctomycetaceae bacterium]